MLDGLKRLFTGPDAPPDEWEPVAHWAASRQCTFRVVQQEGFVVDGKLGTTAWRLEWGPSQRPYIQGHELRLRAELGLPPELQALVMNRELQEKMEKDVFDQYVEGVQTRIDNQTPPEMRWLVMYSKVSGSEMPDLRERYIALASSKSWITHWLQGPLTQAFTALRVDAEAPVVLMIGRGRLMLRTALKDPDLTAMQAWLRLFEAAIREARRVAAEGTDAATPTTQLSAWSSSALPGDERTP